MGFHILDGILMHRSLANTRGSDGSFDVRCGQINYNCSMKIILFHGHFETIGNAEKAAVCMVKTLNTDITTMDTGSPGVFKVSGECVPLAETVEISSFKQILATPTIGSIDHSNEYDNSIFSGKRAQCVVKPVVAIGGGW